MNGFEVTVTDIPAKRLAGMKTRTTMARAKEDCTTLWQTFCPRVPELFSRESYGISVMLDAENFDYWAASDVGNAPTPTDFARVDIPAGAYARCRASNLENLGQAYMFVYNIWLEGQKNWTLNAQAPCFELYAAHWTPDMPIDLYVPVKKAG